MYSSLGVMRCRMNISRTIKAIREASGMDQHELAAKLGVAQGTVSKWESGKSNPRGETWQHLMDLAGEFGINGTGRPTGRPTSDPLSTPAGRRLENIRKAFGFDPTLLFKTSPVGWNEIISTHPLSWQVVHTIEVETGLPGSYINEGDPTGLTDVQAGKLLSAALDDEWSLPDDQATH